MSDILFSWQKVLEVAARRPEGYVEDIRRVGHVHEVEGQPVAVALSPEAYESLKQKYRPKYTPPPAKRSRYHQPAAPATPPVGSGPGTELKGLLKDWLGIQASPNCSCNARARQMDEWGPDLCEQNLPTIVGWLEEQARGRKLPFVRFAAEQAVKLAIRRARKKAAR